MPWAFDSAVGFLYKDRLGRYGLALDMMEEFRSIILDHVVCNLVNRREVKKSDFEYSDSGSVCIKADVKKKLIAAYQNKKQEELIPPVIKYKI